MSSLASTPTAPADLQTPLGQWCILWNTPRLAARTQIEFSSRMTRALGLCYPTRGVIRINSAIATGRHELLLEVLCHEAAHLAAYELHGRKIRPHGREWRELMTAAGYDPRVRLAVELPPLRKRAPQTNRKRYDHHCPVCVATRRARSANRRWRCKCCIDNGLTGKLVITSAPRTKK